jgi:hypothetical protein
MPKRLPTFPPGTSPSPGLVWASGFTPTGETPTRAEARRWAAGPVLKPGGTGLDGQRCCGGWCGLEGMASTSQARSGPNSLDLARTSAITKVPLRTLNSRSFAGGHAGGGDVGCASDANIAAKAPHHAQHRDCSIPLCRYPIQCRWLPQAATPRGASSSGSAWLSAFPCTCRWQRGKVLRGCGTRETSSALKIGFPFIAAEVLCPTLTASELAELRARAQSGGIIRRGHAFREETVVRCESSTLSPTCGDRERVRHTPGTDDCRRVQPCSGFPSKLEGHHKRDL